MFSDLRGFQASWWRIIVFSIVSSFLMQAVMMTLNGLPDQKKGRESF